MIHLRQGVELRRGERNAGYQSIDGQEYVIVDFWAQTYYRIDLVCAAIIEGHDELIADLNPTKVEKLLSFLRANRLLEGQQPEERKGFNVSQLLFFDRLAIKPNPDTFDQYLWLYRLLKHPTSIAILILCYLLGLILVAGQWTELLTYYQVASYSYNDLFALGVVFIGGQVLHELGHALAIRDGGGRVKRMGLTFIAGSPIPLPYTEPVLLYGATRSEKIWVALSGIFIESWFYLICLFMWLGSSDGVVRTLAGFVITIRAPLAVSFTLIPLLKLDGYYALSATLKRPHLYEDAINACRDMLLSILIKEVAGPNERKLLVMYGAAIMVWRVFLVIGICTGLIVLCGKPLGVLLSLLPVAKMMIEPVIKFIKDVVINMKDRPKNFMGIFTAGTTLVLFCSWLMLPMDHWHRVDTYIEPITYPISMQTDGHVVEVKPYGTVAKGEIIVRTFQPDMEIEESRLSAQEAKIATAPNTGEMEVERFITQNKRVGLSLTNQKGLIIAPASGTWIPDNNIVGQLNAGAALGSIVIDERTLVAFLPGDYHDDNVKGYVITNSGESIPLELLKKRELSDVERYPRWVQKKVIDSSLYTAPWESAELGGSFSYKAHFSIMGRWAEKMHSQLIMSI